MCSVFRVHKLSVLELLVDMNASTSAGKFLEDDDGDEDVVAHRTDAFERKYMDDRSWEVLVEDEHGRLVGAEAATLHKRRVRATDRTSRIRRGLIRSVVHYV